MQIGSYRFDRVEFAGSLGDLGTLIPLSIALVTVTHLNFTTVFLLAGIFYVATGLYYELPIPVQPLKVVSRQNSGAEFRGHNTHEFRMNSGDTIPILILQHYLVQGYSPAWQE